MNIRSVTAPDAAALAEIYNYYIDNSIATFELQAIDTAEMSRRIEKILDGGYPFLVCETEEGIAGYAYVSLYKERAAYRHSVETSIYLKHGILGRGIGKALFGPLMEQTRSLGFHAAIAGISLPNDASIRLHERFGFEKVAHFKEVGFKFGQWIDVGYWERLL